MREKETQMLNDEINDKISELHYLEFGSQEYATAAASIKQLVNLRDEDSVRATQLEEQKKDRRIKVVTDLLGTAVPTFIFVFVTKGLSRAETGQDYFTSSSMKWLLSHSPFKWKK